MKKLTRLFMIIAITLFSIQNSHSQNWTWGTPNLWTITDNVGIGIAVPPNKFSVVGSADISVSLGIGIVVPNSTFTVSGTADITGTLGVGTATPSSTFTVSGTADITGTLGVGTSTPSSTFTVAGTADITGTLGIGTASPTNPLTVTGNADVTGSLGVGIAAPAFQLDVMDAINISSFTAPTYYMIDGYTVMHNYGTLNFFAGIFAGNLNPALTGQANTGVGVWAGNAITIGNANSFYGYKAGFATTIGGNNTFFGNQAGENTIGGSNNVCIASGAGNSNISGDNNVFIGYTAGRKNTVSNNVFIGSESGRNNVSGVQNTFTGTSSGKDNTASDNTFNGFESGVANSTGAQNTFSGSLSGQANTISGDNTFTGFSSGILNTGRQNTFTGSQTALLNTTGSANTFIGYLSGSTNSTGSNNTFLGINSGLANTMGSYNTVIGDAANCDATTSHQTAIGEAAVVTTVYTMILGNNRVKVGIGLSGQTGGPLRKLEIVDATDPQLRLSNSYTAAFTDFTSTSTGDLLINPFKSSNQKMGIGLTTSTPPTEVLDVNGNARIRSITTGTGSTNNFIVTGENAVSGTLHKLNFNSVSTDVLHGDGSWGPGGNVTACGGSGGTANYISKFTSANNICNSVIWENNFGSYGNTNIGVHTMPANVPVYNFHNLGTSMFAKSAMSSALTNYNSTSYPLNVLTNNGAGGATGIGIHSNGTYTGSPGRDELNIYVDDVGVTNFRFLSHDVIFHSVTGSMSYMGFNYASRSVQIRDDFASSTAQPTGHLAKLYTETATNALPPLDIAIWGNNTQSYASTTIPVGVRGDVY